MNYRQLTETEIAQLESQSCEAKDWTRVLVADPFEPTRLASVRFEGTALLSNVSRLENYDVGDDVHLEDIGRLVVEGPTSFGNGTAVEALNEGGGRTLTLFDRLSAQTAYLLSVYRHRPRLIEKLQALIAHEVKSKTSDRGRIGIGSRISNVQTIRNVAIGPAARIRGALRLENGTLASSEEAPAHIGEGVLAENFIVLSGSRVEGGAILKGCFVGQGCQIGDQFSAANSVFFANCEAFHGEGSSVFAGPYTVTHHKSTLLIAGMFSFYNAGSGTNQSNHMYKLGPLHQGILERGCKTGSFSYLLWPCHVGAFSVVMNKHGSSFDTSKFPFSYIDIESGHSVLTPAMNLFTVGTKRDSGKWPKRDRRKDPKKLDLITFELFNPYTVGKIEVAEARLKELYENTPREKEFVLEKGIRIRRLMLKTGRKYYEIALKVYLGDRLSARLQDFPAGAGLEAIRKKLRSESSVGEGAWVDLAGLIAPKTSVEDLCDRIEGGQIENIDDLLGAYSELHEHYHEEEWAWCSRFIERRLGVSVSELSMEQIQGLVEDWKTNSIKMNRMILSDAQKEFDPTSQIGFGADGDEAVRKADFEAVRGTSESNSFVKELEEEISRIEITANELIEKLKD